MGLTHVTVKVGNPGNGHRTEDVRCLVDSGAIYSLVPRAVLRRLGIKPHSTREFVLADGDVIHRRLATATFEYEGRRRELRPMQLPLKRRALTAAAENRPVPGGPPRQATASVPRSERASP